MYKFVLCHNYRVGSTLLKSSLERYPCVTCHPEPHHYMRCSPQDAGSNQLRALKTMLGDGDTRFVGLKYPLEYLDYLDDPTVFGSMIQPASIIHIRRRDRLAMYLSFVLAYETGLWSKKEYPHDHRTTINISDMDARLRAWNNNDKVIEDCVDRRLTVWYEDLVADMDGTFRIVAEYIGLPQMPLPVAPDHIKQQTLPMEDRIENYEEAVAYFNSSDINRMTT